MTTAPIPASNAPAAPRPFGPLATLLRRWLGIADQRHDFDALGMTLHMKDLEAAGLRRDLEAHDRALQSLTRNHGNTSGNLMRLLDRVAWHERRVPALIGSKKAYDAALAREKAKRERLIAEHPELTEAERQRVMQTGALPEPISAGEGAESEADLTTAPERRLALVRAAEGIDQADQADRT
jgi:hypothetical protein